MKDTSHEEEVQMPIRMPRSMRADIVMLAAEETLKKGQDVSKNAMANVLLSEAIEIRKKKTKK